MANGKQTSLYLRTEAEEALRRHVERTGRSRSWCASDLIVRGGEAVGTKKEPERGHV